VTRKRETLSQRKKYEVSGKVEEEVKKMKKQCYNRRKAKIKCGIEETKRRGKK